MDDQPEPAEAALALDPGHDVVRQLDPLERPAQAELARMDHEGLVRRDHDLLGQVLRRVAQVDRRGTVVVEHPEGVPEPQVDAGGLDQVRVPRIDADTALADQAQDRPVGEHRGGSADRPCRGLAHRSRKSASAGGSLRSARGPRRQWPNVRARARDGAHARRRQRGRIAVGAAARARAGSGRRGCGRDALDPAIAIRGRRMLGLLFDRPPADVDERRKRNLQRQHQPHESPRHRCADLYPRSGEDVIRQLVSRATRPASRRTA